MTPSEDTGVARLLRFADPVRGPGWNPRSPADPRLNVPRTRALLELAGSPDASLACILVAGTKGKGSTAAFIASVLAAASIRAGLFTSPHLQSWRERIRVDGTAIGSAAFARALDAGIKLVPRLRRRRSDLGEPSAFELLTVTALIHFAERRCRVTVLEVGLGGRYDATNAVDPALSVITPIGLDHQAILGRTLGRIATEKAGVMRPRRATLIARQRPAAARALARECRALDARCETVGPVSRAARVGLAGEHQRMNAGLAAAAVRSLAEVGISAAAVRTGLARVTWPGRFEVLDLRPRIVLDGAHTAESAEALARTLRARFRGRWIHLVLGCTSDRDPRAIARPLLARTTLGYATAASGPRSMPAEQVARAFGGKLAGTFGDIGSAIAGARRDARPGAVVCVTGSLALVGEARTALGLPIPERLW